MKQVCCARTIVYILEKALDKLRVSFWPDPFLALLLFVNAAIKYFKIKKSISRQC
jgi:hypothetical protein